MLKKNIWNKKATKYPKFGGWNPIHASGTSSWINIRKTCCAAAPHCQALEARDTKLALKARGEKCIKYW